VAHGRPGKDHAAAEGADDYDPGRAELRLAGRGIALVPSVFAGQRPSLHEHLNDAKAAPWLVLPVADAGIDHARLWGGPRSGGTRSGGTALAALVGRNRAAVLGSIADGCTTTELAERAGISVAAASQHASVLRDAGLIVTRRQGGAVLHLLTPLGAELLEAGWGRRGHGLAMAGPWPARRIGLATWHGVPPSGAAAPGAERTTGCGFRYQNHQRRARSQKPFGCGLNRQADRSTRLE
jgi:DNA-binding transcriptional ArsR family regulator